MRSTSSRRRWGGDSSQRHGTTLPAAVELPLLHPAVAAVALGARDAAQLDANLDRHDKGVPAELWSELVESGLLDPAVLR
ncbi:hypothetical protein [Promicromonospora panici]|uniref:hypothetical protein n=1 Tax=Promicromonospora panici TaxID=2219658 RepID=UPI001F5D9046|nr:hypothetical protein [Promicromonospora panici]